MVLRDCLKIISLFPTFIKKMKLLFTTEYYHPCKGGIQTVSQQLAERLAQKGHTVMIATSLHKDREYKELNGVEVRQFDISGSFVRGINGNTTEYIKLLKSNSFDIIVNFGVQNWATDLTLQNAQSIENKLVILPIGFSGLGLPSYRKYYKKMIKWLEKYDQIITHSNSYQDTKYLKKHAYTNISIIHNGADENEIDKKYISNIRRKYNINNDIFILHIGSKTGLKGHYEAYEIFRKAKIDNATLMMIGNEVNTLYSNIYKLFEINRRYFPLRNNKRLIIKDLAREELVSALLEADIFLFPSNTECSPLVLYESMAAGTPFLATDVGNSREIAESTGAGMILPTIKFGAFGRAKISKSAKILTEIINDPDKRKVMGNKGIQVWEKEYTWANIANKYELLFKKILSNDEE